MKYIIFLFWLIIISDMFSQDTPKSEKIDRIDKIFKNLEYNTSSFDDLKNTWSVTDPFLVREIFNRFIVSNSLTIDGRKATREEIQERAKEIHKGKVFVELRQRYYDDEIEFVRFYSEEKVTQSDSRKIYIFDPVEDHIFIRNVLESNVYDKLKKRAYIHTDLTKSGAETRQLYNYDIYLSFINPEVMFYSLTTAAQNKFLVSFAGDWGNDNIVLPGWYSPEYNIGIKVKYLEFATASEVDYSYYLKLGIGIPAKIPNLSFIEENYPGRIVRSGLSLNFDAGGNPLKLIYSFLKRFDLRLKGSMSLSQFDSQVYNLDYSSKFYSLRNYVDLDIMYKDILKIFEFGWINTSLGFSVYDFNEYLLEPSIYQMKEINLDENSLNFMVSTKANIYNDGGVISHNFGIQFNYDVSNSFGYIGFHISGLISNTIGAEFKFYKAIQFGSERLPSYRLYDYLVFTPILRINF